MRYRHDRQPDCCPPADVRPQQSDLRVIGCDAGHQEYKGITQHTDLVEDLEGDRRSALAANLDHRGECQGDREAAEIGLVLKSVPDDQLDEAVDVAARHLSNLGDDVGFSLAELCAEANRFDRLKDVDSFKYWLYKIALNYCREEDRRRKRKKWYSIFLSEEARSVASSFGLPEQEYQKKEKEELVAEMLKRLPEEQKTVIIMKEFEGLKFREISETLNISENTAKSRLYYGLKALKKILENSELEF